MHFSLNQLYTQRDSKIGIWIEQSLGIQRLPVFESRCVLKLHKFLYINLLFLYFSFRFQPREKNMDMGLRIAEQYFHIYTDSMKQDEFNELLGNQVTLVQKTNEKWPQEFRTNGQVINIFKNIFERSSNIIVSEVGYKLRESGVILTMEFNKDYLSKTLEQKKLHVIEVVYLKFSQMQSDLKISSIERKISKQKIYEEWGCPILDSSQLIPTNTNIE
jgi:hypothetical protein